MIFIFWVARQLRIYDENWSCRIVMPYRLVPGDVVVLLPGKATADMVVLQGNCLVEESVLSGEVLL